MVAFAGWRIVKSKPHQPNAAHSEKEHEHGDGEHHDEQRIKLTPEQLENANLKIEAAGPATIKTMVAVYGKVAANEEALARVVPRFPGIVKGMKKRLGDRVQRGEVLAQIESNESLKVYDVSAEISGTVIQKDITLGELVKDDKTIFTVANLDTVWIDLSIFRRDFGSLAVGSPVEFHTGEGHVSGSSTSTRRSITSRPSEAKAHRQCSHVASWPNPDGLLRPGLYVDGEVVTGQIEAEVAVANGALQQSKTKQSSLLRKATHLKPREVTIGVKDSDRTQVTKGLEAGERYVAENSFVMKAELGKGEAEHED